MKLKELENSNNLESQEYFSLAVAGAGIGIYNCNLVTGEAFVNDEYLEMIGYKQNEIVYNLNVFFGLIHPEDQFLVQKTLDKMQLDNLGMNIEYRLKHKLGHWVWINSFGKVVSRDGVHGIVKIAGIHIDVSNRKQYEEMVRGTELKFHLLFENMSEGVALHRVIYDSWGNAVDYEIEDVNPAFEKITGLKKENSLKQKASQLYGTGNPPYIEIYARVAQSGKEECFETEFKPMAKCFKISVSSFSKDYFTTVFEDITERKNIEMQKENLVRELQLLQQELLQKQKLLEDKNLALKELVINIEKEKYEIKKQLANDLEKRVLPFINKMEKKAGVLEKKKISIIKKDLVVFSDNLGVNVFDNLAQLTLREQEICNYLKNGLSSKEISEILNVSCMSVNTHRRNIRIKLQLNKKNINLATFLNNSIK